MPTDRFDLASLRPLFRPASIAVIGASTDPTKLSAMPIINMKASGYQGGLYPVNPKAATVQDLPAYPAIGAVPGTVDVAIIAVPETQVKQAVLDCAKKGVRGIVLFTSGFAELGAQGLQAQREIAALVRNSGMRFLGPNCMGVINFENRAVATFHPVFGINLAPKGRIGMVTQSGAFGALVYGATLERQVGYSIIITTGNEGDVDVADGVAYLADDPETAIIMLYLEGCRDAQKLAAALARARARRKPVVAIKVGRTEAGISAVASHTAALAGDDAMFDAMFRQHGAYRASSLEEFVDIGYAAALAPKLPGESVGILTASGGIGVLMADSATAYGVKVAPSPAKLQSAIRAMVPFAAAGNPIDVTGQVASDIGIFERALELSLSDGGFDSIACFTQVGRSPVNAPRFMDNFARLRRDYPEPLIAIAGRSTPEFRAAVERAGCLIFDDPSHTLRAVGALAHFRRALDMAPAASPALPAPEKLPLAPCDEVMALDVLCRAGIPVMPHRLVRSADEAADAAASLGLPVVLKIVSADITHKTDLGGVALNLATAEAVRCAFDEVTRRVAAAAPEARITGCLVAPMVTGGVETILGAQFDPVFGPVVMLGLGGIFVEVLKDVTFRLAPFDESEARRMIEELRAAPALKGVRGRPPADLRALACALAALSRFAAAQGPALKSLDVNPFLVLPEGKGALALDAVLIPG